VIISLLSMTPPPPRSTLFPYTMLFRSQDSCRDLAAVRTRLMFLAAKQDALPFLMMTDELAHVIDGQKAVHVTFAQRRAQVNSPRSEEHTSELQSRGHLVCRLLLEKKKR